MIGRDMHVSLSVVGACPLDNRAELMVLPLFPYCSNALDMYATLVCRCTQTYFPPFPVLFEYISKLCRAEDLINVPNKQQAESLL
jgi:hypothetical protein